MRFRYTFNVQSHTRLNAALQFTYDGYDFRLEHSNVRLTKVVVTSPHAEVPLDWFMLRKHTLYTEPPDPFFEKVQGWLRIIRGAFGLVGVADISIDECLREFFPSTMDEQLKMQTKSMRYERFKRDQMPLGDHIPERLVQCVLSYEAISEYEIPLEFHRRGMNDQNDGRFVEAIVNFFFVLEYLFGGGQHRKTRLIANFQASPALIEGLTEARRQTFVQLRGADTFEMFQERYGNETDEKVITQMVEMRGFLHHQSVKRPRTWHPALQREYAVDAVFTGAVSQYVLSKAVGEILASDEAMAKLAATPTIQSDAIQLGK